MEELCHSCHKNKIWIKKRSLCIACYGRDYRKGKIIISPSAKDIEAGIERIQHESEIAFTKNYFNHNNWTHHPVVFNLGNEKYTPDFYDARENIFIEVVGSQLSYEKNKHKYILLKKLFPKINFELRDVHGNKYKNK